MEIASNNLNGYVLSLTPPNGKKEDKVSTIGLKRAMLDVKKRFAISVGSESFVLQVGTILILDIENLRLTCRRGLQFYTDENDKQCLEAFHREINFSDFEELSKCREILQEKVMSEHLFVSHQLAFGEKFKIESLKESKF